MAFQKSTYSYDVKIYNDDKYRVILNCVNNL